MSFDVEAKAISRKIESELSRIGIFHRIFYRSKTIESLKKKIQKSPGKYGKDKKIQDVIGIRVCLYFSDDIEVTNDLINELYNIDFSSSNIDKPEHDQFGPVRYNLVYDYPDFPEENFTDIGIYGDVVDKKFEVQIRTILSEGWHEVEHDLRYKFSEDWQDNSDASRALNGVFASLETSEITMLKIIEDQAYFHYKNQNWSAMIRSKFRLRFTDHRLDDEINKRLNDCPELAKAIYRFNRSELIAIFSKKIRIPITIKNVIYVINYMDMRDDALINSTPEFIAIKLKGVL